MIENFYDRRISLRPEMRTFKSFSKSVLGGLMAATCTLSAMAQSYDGPESVEYDYANGRWLVANKNSGAILARANDGTLTTFASNFSSSGPYGIEIVGNYLYACANGGTLLKFDLAVGGPPVASVPLGATFLNGITHDNAGNLYITDFTAKKIYRYNTVSGQYNVYVTGLVKSPNGIYYDEAQNRCVFVNWGTSAPIMAVSLADSSISTLATTSLSNCDGISRDGSGNWYVSNWGINGISRFSPDFSTGPTTVVTGLSSPADIFFNTVTDTLAVPNSGASGTNGNTVTFHWFGTATGVQDAGPQTMIDLAVDPAHGLARCYLDRPGRATLSFTDASGRVLLTKEIGHPTRGWLSHRIDMSHWQSGIYIANLSFEGRTVSQRFSMLR